MTHRFPVKEIAAQAGLGVATVDRVLHDRPNVSPQAKQRVRDAISELKRQEGQLFARGRKFFVDVVIEAPARFSRKVQKAAEMAIVDFLPAVIRLRFHCAQEMSDDSLEKLLAKIARRGSDGVCLKARDIQTTRNAVAMLAARNIPTVTIVTDIDSSERIAYAGIDNAKAGALAAHLMVKSLADQKGHVLVSTSQPDFEGEARRRISFRNALMRERPDLGIIEVSGGAGLEHQTQRRVEAIIADYHDVISVYSMGGGNRAILVALASRSIQPRLFIAHDLDQENQQLLAEGEIDFVIDHDLRQDMRAAFVHIGRFHKLLRHDGDPMISVPQILTQVQL